MRQAATRAARNTARAERHRYAHLDMGELEECLKKTQDKRQRLIATDGIVALADKYDAIIFVDDCHATGFFGDNGAGTPSHCTQHPLQCAVCSHWGVK
eukprot:gene51413-44175_t